MKLVSKKDGHEIKVGELVIDFRGDEAKVIDVTHGEPTHDGSSGCIYTDMGSYYPEVFDCKWVKS